MRVLVVDDEPALRSAVQRALALERYDVALAEDGRQALDRLAAEELDAVVLDIAMPHVDGLEVCRRMRQAGDRTPVLMLTARDAIDDRVAGLDAGADDYLVKPFALRELLARLRALLRRVETPGAAPALRRPRARSGLARRLARRAAHRAHAHRVRAAGALPRPPAPGPHALADLRAGLGLRLRRDLQRSRRLHRLPAAQDRGGRRAAAAAHGPRRGLRAARAAVTLRRRLTLMSAVAQGSGLGLTIVRQVADAHGATVVTANPPAAGSSSASPLRRCGAPPIALVFGLPNYVGGRGRRFGKNGGSNRKPNSVSPGGTHERHTEHLRRSRPQRAPARLAAAAAVAHARPLHARAPGGAGAAVPARRRRPRGLRPRRHGRWARCSRGPSWAMGYGR